MKIKVFSIYDVKSEIYSQPFYQVTEGAALRAWVDLVNDGRSNVSQHPEDYCLFLVAEYDDTSANFETLTPPKSLGLALEYKRTENT